MNNFKMNFALVGKGARRDWKDKKTGVEKSAVPCLLVRAVDVDLGELMNADKTYPHVDAVVVRLLPELADKLVAYKSIVCVCDSMALGEYQEKISVRKIKIGNEFISLFAEDNIDKVSTAVTAG